MNTLSKVWIGVDVAKNTLEIHIHPMVKGFSVSNTEAGIQKFLQTLTKYQVEQIVCEASGGYEFLMYRMLKKAGYQIWRVEPKRVKAFIYSEGQRAKTDKIDAKMLAIFASQKQCKNISIELSDEHYKLSSFNALRARLVEINAMQKAQLKGPMMQEHCNKILEDSIAFLEEKIVAIDKEIHLMVKMNQQLSAKIEILTSMTGIGILTAINLATGLPELGILDNKEIVALVGVAPYPRQSGTYIGKASISGGRAVPRKSLYMAALSASRSKSIFGSFYKKLRLKGKKAKIAIVALMRKMLVVLNTLIRKNEAWNPIA